MDIFEADGCTILAHRTIDEQPVLAPVATTGLLTRKTEQPIHDFSGIRHELKLEGVPLELKDKTRKIFRGLTRYMGLKQGSVVRKIDVHDPLEPLDELEKGLGLISEGEYIENLVPRESGHHRFLGSSVLLRGEPVGVIRVVRRNSKRPFVEEDSRLIRGIACLCGEALKQNEETARDAEKTRLCAERWVIDDTNSPVRRKAVERLMNPSPSYTTWNRRSAENILQDLLLACEGVGGLVANIGFVTRDRNGARFLRPYIVRSRWTAQPPEEHESESVPEARPSISWHALNESTPVHYSRDRCGDRWKEIHRDSAYVKAGVSLPFSFLASGNNATGVLSLDFDREPDDEVVKRVLGLMLIATRKMAWMASDNSEGGHWDRSITRKYTYIDYHRDLVKRFDDIHVFVRNSASELFCEIDHEGNRIETSSGANKQLESLLASREEHPRVEGTFAQQLRDYTASWRREDGWFLCPTFMGQTEIGRVLGQLRKGSMVDNKAANPELAPEFLVARQLSDLSFGWTRWANSRESLLNEWSVETSRGKELPHGVYNWNLNPNWIAADPDLQI